MSVMPTTPIIGADTDQLRTLADQLKHMAGTVAGRTMELRDSINELSPSWMGASRDRGMQLWEATMPRCFNSVDMLLLKSRQLVELAARLEEVGSHFGDRVDTMCVDLKDPETTKEGFWIFGKEYQYERQEGELFVDGINPDDVSQGRLGNCYFLAALASIARQSPELIRQNITYEGNQTYSVTFYDPDGNPVKITVDSDLPVDDKGNLVYAQTGAGGSELWVALYEKAYAQYRDGYPTTEGGLPGEAVSTITGQPPEILDQKTVTTEDLYQRFVNGNILTAGIFQKDLSGNPPPGVHGNHAYSIVGVDPVKGTVTLRNPWGFDHPQEMSIQDFRKYCGYIASNG